MTKALAEGAKCHVSDDHFESRQLQNSAQDLGIPEITVYSELVIKRTTLYQNNIA